MTTIPIMHIYTYKYHLNNNQNIYAVTHICITHTHHALTKKGSSAGKHTNVFVAISIYGSV